MTPLELLIRILVHGGRVQEGGLTWAMAEDGDVCWLSGEGTEEVAHGTDMTVRSLKQMAENIGKDELWLRCCEMQLTKIQIAK